MDKIQESFFENIEENPKATEFGQLKYGIVSMEGLGLNPNEVLFERKHVASNGTKIIISSYGDISGKLEGTFNSRDFLTVHASANSFSNIYGIIVTKDSHRISVKVLGETTADGNVYYQIQLRHNSTAYNWVNEKFIFAKGTADKTSQLTTLKLYAFDENPFDSIMAWEDPDACKVDYKNFPYTLEDFKKDDKASIIYCGDGHLNTVESFGADVNKVFTGQFPIPEEGLRLNGYFSGPTSGNINGVISGVNYLRVMPDGAMHMNSKIIASTYEGETLLLEALGASFPATGPAWWETSRGYSNLKKYEHLTKLHNLGVGSTNVQNQLINYNHYGYETIKLDNQH